MSNEPTREIINEAICVFMGWEFIKVDEDFYHALFEGNLMWADNRKGLNKTLLEGFKYHSSWDWLMPVVLKAKALYLNYETGQMRDELKMRYKAIENELCNLNLINTHYCLYKFLQWYNKAKEVTNG